MVNFKILMCEKDQHSNVNLKGNTCTYSIDYQRTYSTSGSLAINLIE